MLYLFVTQKHAQLLSMQIVNKQTIRQNELYTSFSLAFRTDEIEVSAILNTKKELYISVLYSEFQKKNKSCIVLKDHFWRITQ